MAMITVTSAAFEAMIEAGAAYNVVANAVPMVPQRCGSTASQHEDLRRPRLQWPASIYEATKSFGIGSRGVTAACTSDDNPFDGNAFDGTMRDAAYLPFRTMSRRHPLLGWCNGRHGNKLTYLRSCSCTCNVACQHVLKRESKRETYYRGAACSMLAKRDRCRPVGFPRPESEIYLCAGISYKVNFRLISIVI